MPDFLPFPGIRYAVRGADADLSAVCAPPYDVIDDHERALLTARDPYNAVRLILPDTYRAATQAFARWRAEGVLVTEPEPTFSVYRMEFRGEGGRPRHTTGVLGALGLDDANAVLPHERTLPKAKRDRLELLQATRANLDPIWALSTASGLSALLEPTGPPLAHAIDGDGVRHALWRVSDGARIDAITRSVSSAQLVLADGHHRFETACTYREERVTAGIDDPGAGAIMTFVVELTADQLCVRSIHRLLNGLGGTDLRTALSGPFRVEDLGPNRPEVVDVLAARMADEGVFGLVDAQGLAVLRPERALDDRMSDEPSVLRAVDSARFDAGVLPHVGKAVVTYRNDARAVAALVEQGRADAAVLLRPVGVDTIRAAAAAGIRMPEKTTFFAPKPRTGMVFRSLDGVD